MVITGDFIIKLCLLSVLYFIPNLIFCCLTNMTNNSILLLIHVDHLCIVFCFIFFLVTNDSINVKLCTFCTFRMAVKILLHSVQVVCKFGITIVYDYFFLTFRSKFLMISRPSPLQRPEFFL